LDIVQNLKRLTEAVGVSGDEHAASAVAAEMLSEYCEDVSADPFGNVTGFLKSDNPDAKTLMLDAHIDRIGMIVTYIEDSGFLRLGACGGLDMRVMAAQSVTVHAGEKLSGVISALPPHVSSDHSKVPEIGELAVDIGMTGEQARKAVSPGDRVTVNSAFRALGNNCVSAAAIDDRSGVCAILAALDMLKGKRLKYNLAVCFSAQEETGERGVKQAAFRIQPDEAIAVDVSFGRTPDSSAQETAELGSGVMIGFSAALDKNMSNSLKALAQEKNIPFTCEIMPSSTGTNADSIAVSGRGVRCCTLSFPIRYMHTAVETVNIADIEATARLICEYVGGEENV
jgi:endoglucanase